jgi:hypothetical protein
MMLCWLTIRSIYICSLINSNSSRHYTIQHQNIYCTLVFQSASVARLTIIKYQHSSKPSNVRRKYSDSVLKMNSIEFIPLIEPATKKDAESEIIPSGTSLTNSTEWDTYQKQELKKNYLNFPEPISNGIYQYKLFDIDLEDLERVIDLHIGDTDINESISLFGGYAISKNGIIELYPQCCGLLKEIQTWKNILQENFQDFYLKECHPSPLITKRDNEIIIYCTDDLETYIPVTTKAEIKLNYFNTKAALLKLLNQRTFPFLIPNYHSLSDIEKQAHLKGEKSLLYVSFTRAIHKLLVTGTGSKSSLIPDTMVSFDKEDNHHSI